MQRRTAMPMAAIFLSPIQMPVNGGRRVAVRPKSLKVEIAADSKLRTYRCTSLRSFERRSMIG